MKKMGQGEVVRRKRIRDCEEDTINREKMKKLEEAILFFKKLREEIPKFDIYFLMDETWYAIKSANFTDTTTYGGIRKKRLEPALPEFHDHVRDRTFAAVGSKIFTSGGFDHSSYYEERKKDKYKDIRLLRLLSYDHVPSNKVFCIDILHLEEGWKAAAPMSTVRAIPYMVADSGKMYVFGGLLIRHPSNPIDENRIFAEVYDPSNPDVGWKTLACISDEEFKLPQTINGHAFVDGDSDDRKILFHSHFGKSLYYLSTTRQETGDYDNNFGQYHTSSAFLDGFLFFFDRTGMYAYDVTACSGKELNVYLHGVREDTLPHHQIGESKPRRILQSLGKEHLALVWAKSSEYDKYIVVHCSIIKICKNVDYLVGKVVSYSSYSVKSGQLMSCMAVCSPEEDVSFNAERDKSNMRIAAEAPRKRKRQENKGL